jgi:glycine oxidase
VKAAILGAGIMGRLLTYELVNAGWQVSLFDQDDEHGHKSCSMAAAGLLATCVELEKSNSVIYDLGLEALLEHWPRIINHLDNSIYFSHTGSLLLAHPRDRNEMYRFINTISARSSYQKKYTPLTKQMISDLEPELNKFGEGFFFPEEGQLDNQAVMKALGSYFQKKINWITNTIVEQIDDSQFDLVCDCRGLGAKSAFKNLRGVRGELIWLYAPDVSITRPVRLVHPRYNLYIAPRPEHIYLLGASEIESEDMSNISVRTLFELLSSAYYLHSGFDEARILKTVVHCRPTLSDHLPKIKYSGKFVYVNGLYRHGFLIAPTIASEILRWLQHGSSSWRYPLLWEKIKMNTLV